MIPYLGWADVVFHELIQLEEEGYLVGGEIKERYRDLLEKKASPEQFRDFYQSLRNLPKNPSFPYEEPDGLDEIRATRPPGPRTLRYQGDPEQLQDRIYGAWLGRAAGCLLGKPVEGWSRQEIITLLQKAGRYPLDSYFKDDDPADHVEEWKRHNFYQSIADFQNHRSRDDDLDYTVIALRVLERRGSQFQTEHVAEMWLSSLPILMTYTAERVAYANLCAGFPLSEVRFYRNPYREWIGAQIRADLWGYVNPGRPERAAELAFRDASLSHVKNGVYGAMWVASMLAAAYCESDIRKVIEIGLSEIPEKSRLAEAIRLVLRWHEEGRDWESAGEWLDHQFGRYHPVHTINNAAIVALALLYGELDLEKTISIAVMLGLDTDCNAATAGSVVGLILGAKSLPEKWIAPLKDQFKSYVAEEGIVRISHLAERTARLTNL